MKRIAIAFVAGLLFGAGLLISGMANPANVLGFFDVAGAWNPTLAFVMAGGLAVTMAGYRLAFVRQRPLCADDFQVPRSTSLDVRLLVGAAVFGAGWGLAGYCPGPALAASGAGVGEALAFSAAMVAGMLAWRVVAWRLATCPLARRRAPLAGTVKERA